MRLFIAAPIPQPLLAAIQNYHPNYTQPGVRLVPAANLHLTLHFLGETPPAVLPALLENLQEIAQSHQAFNLSFKEISPGPKIKSPRLVWVRFKEHPAFEKLARAINKAMPDSGNSHPDFIPHITIARLKKEKLTGAPLPVIQEVDFPDYPVNSVALWRSELASPHPHYTVVQEFSLNSEVS